MADWKTIVTDHHARVHAQPGDKLLVNDGADPEAIDQLQKTLRISLPDEFRALYSECNGFGLTYEDHDQECWFCHPIDQIEEFVQGTRKWFAETHAEVALRFFPFIDWANGDGMGYLLDEDERLLPGLYCFEHELYEFEDDQEFDEFIVKWNNSIHELLVDGAGVVEQG